MAKKRKFKLYSKKKFICEPRDIWIEVIRESSKYIYISILKKGHKGFVYRQEILLDDHEDVNLNSIVKNFCIYITRRYILHSNLILRDAVNSLGSVSNILGLVIWRRKRPNPYA